MLEIFIQEHEEALAKLQALEEIKKGVELEEKWPVNINDITNFFDNNLKRHFRIEEFAIFPVLARFIKAEDSSMAALVEDHKQMKKRFTDLHRIMDNPDPQKTEFFEAGNDIIKTLSEHIKKEDTDIFSLARELFKEPQLKEIEVTRQIILSI